MIFATSLVDAKFNNWYSGQDMSHGLFVKMEPDQVGFIMVVGLVIVLFFVIKKVLQYKKQQYLRQIQAETRPPCKLLRL